MLRKLFLLLFLVKSLCGLFTKNNACKDWPDYWIKDVSPNCFYNPDVGKNTPEILQYHFGRYENHTVTTEDGYILHIFRVPRENPKGVIMLQHPVTTDSIIWVGQGNTSAADFFWNAGYDIWLPNQRGTFFSDQHVNLSANQFEFWNFSFHEIGLYDYSAFAKYISQVTNSTEIIFIGHSESGTASLIYASLKPEEAKQYFKVFIDISPITSLSYMRSFMKHFAVLRNIVDTFSRTFKIGSVLRYNSLSGHMFRLALHFPFKFFLISVVSFVSGGTPFEFDPRWYTTLFSQGPRGLSMKIVTHYAQFVKGTFNQFDYGKNGNLLRYNSEVPPEYPVWNIKSPIYVVASQSDSIGTVKDSEELFSKLSEEAKVYGMYIMNKLNHIDIQLGKDRKGFLYEPLLSFIEKIFN